MVVVVRERNVFEVGSIEIRALSNGATARDPPFPLSAVSHNNKQPQKMSFLIFNDDQ